MDDVKNLTAIKDFFNIMPPANNCAFVKTCTCNVDYETDVSDYTFKKELSVDINISNADYRYVYIHDIDEETYHTQFQSNFQDFSFDNDSLCLTIKGNASNKKFSNYEIKISICQNKIKHMIDEETKKTASELVNAIKEKFDKLEIRKISEKYETEIEYGLGQNKEKGYIGRFFDIKDKLSIWAGYDYATEHFCISFYSEKYKEQLISALEDLHLNYSAEYIAFDDEGYWYSIFVDTPYKNNKNREPKNYTNEINYTSVEQDIENILENFKGILL